MKNQNKVQFPILGFLIQTPMSGYDLKKQMDISVANFMSPSFGNIYPTLKSLEKKGFIKATQPKNKRGKKIYTVTPAGQTHFLDWLSSPPDDPFLARVFFMNLLNKEERITLIDQYIKSLEAELNHLDHLEKNYRPIMGDYPYQTLQFGKYIYQKELEYYQAMQEGEKNELS